MYREAGKDLNDDMHVPLGGDELTRERFSIAKLMRLGNNTGVDQFVNLSPVVFEFMHLGMNFLDKLPLTLLWHKDGDRDVGMMKSAAQRISRNNVEPGASKAYTANKEYFVSYTNAYIIEGLRDFFGMKELNDVPSKNGPPLDRSETDKWTWLQSTIKTFIDRYAFPHWSGSAMNNDVEICHVDVGPFMTVILSNGTQLRIPVTPRREPIISPTKPDEVKNYAHLSLELGIVFKYFLQLCHTPNRKKFLALMKMMLVMMKARNPKAKYPREILRLLVQQYSLLPEKEARQVFFASFVNTRG